MSNENDLRTLLSSSRGEQGWRTMDSAPKDGTHIIGNTQWGAREIWWHKDTYEGEYWTDEGDSEPEPTGWIPMPGSVPTSADTNVVREALVTASMALTAHNDWHLKRTDPEVLDGVEHIPAEAYAESTLYELTDDALNRIKACETASVPTSLAGHKILEGLRDAVAGDLPRVTIEGVTYVRQDAVSPEALLAESRQTIDALQTELDALKATSLAGQGPDGYVLVPKELSREIGDAMIEAMWPSGEVIIDDEFDGPEQQLAAGWAAAISAAS
jgi:hypothetical protein